MHVYSFVTWCESFPSFPYRVTSFNLFCVGSVLPNGAPRKSDLITGTYLNVLQGEKIKSAVSKTQRVCYDKINLYVVCKKGSLEVCSNV